MIIYFLKSVICLGISFLLYRFLLKTEKSFVFNRFYLLATVLLSLIIPKLEIDSGIAPQLNTEINMKSPLLYGNHLEEEIDGTSVMSFNRRGDIQKTLVYAYLLISLFFILRLALNLANILKMLKNKGPQTGFLNIVLTERKTKPYSFFKYLIINRKSFIDEVLSEDMIRHEQVHGRQWHTLDLILVEIVLCLFWINPFLWLYKKAISENHEYLADYFTVKETGNKDEYQNLIIQSAKCNYTSGLVSGFSYIQTKNRLIMLNKSKSSITKVSLKLTLVIITAITVFTLSSFEKAKNPKEFIVVVDAGHGGKDSGAVFNGQMEKDINLDICSKIKALSTGNKVKIMLTRSSDKFLSLEERSTMVNEINPDLFLSIHCNVARNKKLNGIEAYYCKTGKFESESFSYSKALVQEQVKTLAKEGEVKTADFFVLKNSDCPAVLLNVGFLSNGEDYGKLTSSKYRNTLAKSIYEGLVKLGRQ